MAAVIRATAAERAAHSGTYPLHGFVTVGGVRCDVENTAMGDGGPKYEIRAPRGSMFANDYVHGLNAYTLAEVRELAAHASLIACECCAPRVSLAAVELCAMIRAKIEENNGHPVHVKNPLVLELIAAGLVIETAPRDTWEKDGAPQMMAVVNVPKGAR